jgi:formylglycine-generating enzyme required for sulfatase activity
VEEEFTNSIGMKFTLIPSGECPMSLLSATERRHEDAVLQRVKMMKPFFLGIFEVTQREYERIMGVNPSRFSGKGNQSGRVSGMDTTRFPVEGVSWWDAVEFCEKLSALPKEREQGRRFRLPTEAEWDYACRAGSEYAFHFGNDPKQLATFAWYGDNSGESTVETDGPFRTLKFAEYWDMIYANGGRPHSVGSRAQNPWGLFDMHGNVWEYCFPAEPTTGEARACRGGSWFFPSTMCQLVHRRMQLPDKRFNDCGFRAVCAIRD